MVSLSRAERDPLSEKPAAAPLSAARARWPMTRPQWHATRAGRLALRIVMAAAALVALAAAASIVAAEPGRASVFIGAVVIIAVCVIIPRW